MKKFLIINQDQEPMIETRWNEFTCGILELAGFFVVSVATCRDVQPNAESARRRLGD